jgi:penicillin-binding protein 1A
MEGTNKKNRKYLIWFWALVSIPFILGVVLFILISKEVLGPMPGFEELENPEENLAAEVYAEDGVLLGKFYYQNRTWTDYDEISPDVVNALIATEDIRFYRHSGIDVRGLGRVVVKTLLLGQNTGGGSTISQQLAKNLFPRDMADDSKIVHTMKLGVSKFKEWETAVKLERSYTKEEIITMYLNIFDFIYNAVGIRSAAQIYFNTTPDSLNIQQSATLVGMLKNSALYNPVRNPKGMLTRRNIVLDQMANYGYLTRHVADSIKLLPIELDFQDTGQNSGLAQYLREYVRTTMIAQEPERKMFYDYAQYKEARWQWDNNPLYGWCRKNKKADGSNYNIYKDGLKIYTTINSKMQKYAEDALTEHLSGEIQPSFNESLRGLKNPPFSNDLSNDEVKGIMNSAIRRSDRYRAMRNAGKSEDSIQIAFNTKVKMKVFSWKGERDTIMTPLDSIRYYKTIVRSSFMVMQPDNGNVKAYVGGPDFRYFKYDAVTQQKRQVGSTIKPFLYTLAIQDGKSPCYLVENIPRSFDIGDTVPYIPKSSGPPEFHGKFVTLRWGLAQSENYISAWVMKQFSPTAVVDIMHRMGIRDTIDPVVSIFLGTSDISLDEMVGAYGTFANKGIYTTPMYVTRIEDRNGNLISSFTPKVEEVISEDDAYLMMDMLQGVVKSGTAIRLRNTYQLTNQIGGKTGTTQNHGNGWFMGLTPNLIGGVWAGWEDQSIHFQYIGEGQGANMALPTFGIFLKKLYADPQFAGMVEDQFEKPAGFNMELNCDIVNKETIRKDNFYQEKY